MNKKVNFESVSLLKKINKEYRKVKGVNSWISTDVTFYKMNDDKEEAVYCITMHHTNEDENGVITNSWTTTDWFYLKEDGSYRFQYSYFNWKTGTIKI